MRTEVDIDDANMCARLREKSDKTDRCSAI
jgi:hypothetical protein